MIGTRRLLSSSTHSSTAAGVERPAPAAGAASSSSAGRRSRSCRRASPCTSRSGSVESTRQPKMCFTNAPPARRRLSSRSPWNIASCSDRSIADLQRLVGQLRGRRRARRACPAPRRTASAPRGTSAANFSALGKSKRFQSSCFCTICISRKRASSTLRLYGFSRGWRRVVSTWYVPSGAAVPQQRHADGVLVLAVDDEQAVAEVRPRRGSARSPGPTAIAATGVERRDAAAVAVDLELDRHKTATPVPPRRVRDARGAS